MAHIEMVRYTAKRTKDGLEEIGREILGVIPGNPDESISDLARIIAPSLFNKFEKSLEESDKVSNRIRGVEQKESQGVSVNF
ncbi:hypothetical protein N752_00960 [Desulforamulus aquiferis]|nr:hypothetical protein [Desulforamulus aquiferis]RYD07184.1 hypothetical protein N752_00960 [Desulforamulus aquiferis]